MVIALAGLLGARGFASMFYRADMAGTVATLRV